MTDNLTRRFARESLENLDLDWFEEGYDDVKGNIHVLTEVKQWAKDMRRSLRQQERQYKAWIGEVREDIRRGK